MPIYDRDIAQEENAIAGLNDLTPIYKSPKQVPGSDTSDTAGKRWVKVNEGNIVGDDPSGGEVSLSDAPVVPQDKSKIISDESVKATTEKSIKTQLEGKTDSNLVNNASKILGDSTGLADVIAKLDAGIDKQESKRDSVKLMMFGLSMLSGEGMARSVQVANSVGGFNKQRIDELYDQRKTIQDRVSKEALDNTFGASGSGDSSVFGDTYVDPDGNKYFKYKDQAGYEGPDGEKVLKLPSGTVKQTSQSADLPSSVLKSINTLTTEADDADGQAEQFEFVKEDILANPAGSEGIFGTISESVKNTFGWQGGTSQWKVNYRRLKNETAIDQLPPGVASDRDIAIVMEGFPKENWDQNQLISWINGYQKLLKYNASYKRFRSQWIEENRGKTKGMRKAWEESETYKEWTKQNVQAPNPSSGKKLTTKSGISYTIE